MDCQKEDKTQAEGHELISDASLTLVREFVQHERLALGDVTSYRTNHTYERVEELRRIPAILGVVTTKHGLTRPGPQSIEYLRKPRS